MVKMSVIGLLNYDPDLFNETPLPDGIDRETFVSSIVHKCGGFPVLYPNAGFFKNIVNRWAFRRLPIWERMYNTTKLEYNPIENYDRNEESTEENSRTGTGATSTTTNDHSTGTNDSYSTGFNSGSLVQTGENVADTSTTATGESNSTSSENGAITRTSRIHGNIGVTTSQQMLESEREVAQFDIYEFMADDFCNEFCIQLY